MRDPVDLAPGDLLCFNLYALSHAFTRFYQPLLAPLGLTYPQYLVMISLRQQDGQGVGQLSQELALETNTLSPMLKRLEAGGMIRRSRCDPDERKVIVHLTEAGRGIADRASLLPNCIVGCLGLPTSELSSLSEATQRLRELLRSLQTPEVPETAPQDCLLSALPGEQT